MDLCEISRLEGGTWTRFFGLDGWRWWWRKSI